MTEIALGARDTLVGQRGHAHAAATGVEGAGVPIIAVRVGVISVSVDITWLLFRQIEELCAGQIGIGVRESAPSNQNCSA